MPPRRLPVCVLAAALAAAAPASAEAAATIGSNLAAEATDNVPGSCFVLCTGLNLDLPAGSLAPGGVRSPGDGVVVRWRVKSGSAGNPVALRVLRPAGGASSTGAGRSAEATTAAGLASFDARLPIRAGDGIGLDIANSAIVWATTAAANGLVWSSGLPEGATAPGTAPGNRELLVQAVIEGDADHDGFGDETQDLCPTDANRQAPPCSQPAPPPPRPPARDTTPPRLTGLAVRPSSVRLGRRARIAFRVSERARVTLRFARLVRGRIRGGRCVRATRRLRRGRGCTLASRVGSVTLRAQGAESLPFDGRLTGRRLAPGRYRVTATAVDGAQNVSRSLARTFTMRPARRR